MTVNQIIKKSIERLKNEGKLLTPDFYAEAFCKEAKIAGILIEDCTHIEKYLHTLDTKLQNEIKQYHLKTTQEFIRFLISRINRMQPSQCAELLTAQSALSKRILQVVGILHNTDASALANKTILAIDENPTPEQLEHFRQAWMNFLTMYDDTFLHQLSAHGKVDTRDLKRLLEGVRLAASDATPVRGVSSELESVASLMVASLVPSIASSVNDEIATISETLRTDPQMLTSKSVAEDIKEAIGLRIALDKESVKEMMVTLDMVLDKLSLQLIDLIECSDSSTTEIQVIKAELEAFEEEKKSDFKTAHRKLYTIVIALEEKTDLLTKDLTEHSDKVSKLSRRVSELESELAVAEQVSQEDFLTKIANRRALDRYLKIKEGEFERYNRNFSIVFFDLDYFKKINDTYGHDAGDAVLSAFGKILKQQCRNVDIVGRYGGEEFLALLSDTDLKGGIIFAQKVREMVCKTRFIYKGKRIEVTLSAGVAERIAFPALKALVNSADQCLYDAKNNGRDRVEPSKK